MSLGLPGTSGRLFRSFSPVFARSPHSGSGAGAPAWVQLGLGNGFAYSASSETMYVGPSNFSNFVEKLRGKCTHFMPLSSPANGSALSYKGYDNVTLYGIMGND